MVSVSQLQTDHPHACGDKLIDRFIVALSNGSSPRVWGQASLYLVWCPTTRIIPTRVGTSLLSHYHLTRAKDHPHACGDKLIDRFIKRDEKGSSPRVWGQEFVQFVRHIAVRIIPTRVGTRQC